MTALNQDIYIDQNASFSLVLAVPASPGYNGQIPTSNIRSAYQNNYANGYSQGSAGPMGGILVATFTIAAVSGNSLTLVLTQAQTAAIIVPIQARRDQRTVLLGPYDIICPNVAGGIDRLFMGNAYLNRGAT